MDATINLEPVPGRQGLPRLNGGRRRDRRGRRGRGSLLPPGVPASLTRAEIFDDLVVESAERLETRWGSRVSALRFEVDQVPGEKELRKAAARGEAPPLGRVVEARRGEPTRIVVHRRPVETVAGSAEALPWLLHDVVVELVAEALMIPPEDLDPGYGAGGPPSPR